MIRIRSGQSFAAKFSCLLAAVSQRGVHTNHGIGIQRCQAFHAHRIAHRGQLSITTSPRQAAALQMNFISDFFDSWQSKMSTGGSYNLGIDYDALAFPGPEVGAMAIELTSASLKAKQNGDPIPHAPSVSPSLPNLELATFAGGCFWGLELALQRCEGVEHTLVGYTQGREVRPNYEQVSAGNTGHCEAVMVYFDPTKTSYESILRTVFLSRVDITTVDGQGRDFGKQYRTGIYFHTPEQQRIAERLLQEEISSNPKYATTKSVATEVKPSKAFWPAEGYHQKYLERGGRFGMPQSAEKGNNDEIRCYG